MKNPEFMTDKQIAHWLNKTRQSITNRPISLSSHSRRGLELVDRYELLREEAIDRDNGVWDTYCDYHFSCTTHDAWDMFA